PLRVKILAGKALSSIQRVSGMVDELLDTMAFHGGQKIRLDLSQVDIGEIVKEVQVDALAAHGPRIRVEGPSVVGWWDRMAMKRAAENLVSNDVKYGSPGTPVTIRTGELHGRLVLT